MTTPKTSGPSSSVFADEDREQDVDLAHAFEPAQRLHHARRDLAVDRHQRHRLAPRRAAAEVEGGDVDPGLAERGAELADEAGRVGVDDVDHRAVEFGLDLDPEHLDQPRRLVAEQGPGDAALAAPSCRR